MGNKTILRENLNRTIKFNENYLNKLDNFLRSNFSKVFYELKTNKRSLNKKIELEDFLRFMKEIGNEKVEYINVYSYKDDKNYYATADLSIIFKKLNISRNVEYEYKDGHENSDIGFLEKLNNFLKTNRRAYAFLFDDGFFPFYWKIGFIQMVKIGLAVYLGFLFLNFVNEGFGFNLASFSAVSSFYLVNAIFNYFFPKSIFVLTEKEKGNITKYNFINKVLLGLLSGIFFIFLGVIIDRYFFK